MEFEDRFNAIVHIYDNIETVLNNLPEAIPAPVKNTLKKAILDDKELKALIDGIKNRRAPRFLLIGNSGHGKSSLINAILGYYHAPVSAVAVGTKKNEHYDIVENGKTVYSILDSRGINESAGKEEEAEEQLLRDMENFTPDCAIYVHKAKERSGMREEIAFLKNVREKYQAQNKAELPIIIVLTQCDELEPASKKEPASYPPRKLDYIHEAEKAAREIAKTCELEVKDVIVTSSLMEYSYSNEELDTMSASEVKNLSIETDGRYNIEELKQLLFDSIAAMEAQMGLVAGNRAVKQLRKIAKKLTHIFAGIAGTVALTPIPVSDMFILMALEGVLVMLISMLSGRELSYKAAIEYVAGAGGIGAVGFGLKMGAQQAVKFANVLFPGAGSGISAAIATAGMEMIGKTATEYYLAYTK